MKTNYTTLTLTFFTLLIQSNFYAQTTNKWKF
jgi:hypothetical protein